jgi:KDO2-lipid IV(A) lauroyltransferase
MDSVLGAPARLFPLAARRVGAGVGSLVHRLSARRRRVAGEALRDAFPELDGAARRRLARAAFRARGAAAADHLACGRLDPVGFCRRLTLEGWERLLDAEAGERGWVALLPRLGPWRVAVLPLGLYRGPTAVGEGAGEEGRWLERLDRRFRVERLPEGVAGGRRVAFPFDPETAGGSPAGSEPPTGGRSEVISLDTFLGRPARVAASAFRLAVRSGAPLVPIFARPVPAGGWRVTVRAPIDPATAPAEGEVAGQWLARRAAEIVEEEVRRSPELWSWHRGG